jgi:hypothetical protein
MGVTVVTGNGFGGSDPDFLVSVSADGRSLLDQNGQPVLMLSDQLLPCLTNGTLANCQTVMADRQARGYNALWVCLINDSYIGANDSFTDNDGNAPFSGAGLSSPNNAYWSRVDSLVASAKLFGFTLILTPIETAGLAMGLARTAGTAGCTAYGTFLGNRYKTASNIVWLFGNDFGVTSSWIAGPPANTNVNGGIYDATPTPSDATLGFSIMAAITATGDTHLQTNELNYNLSLGTDSTIGGTSGDGSGTGWRSVVQMTQVYSYYKTYVGVDRGYARTASDGTGTPFAAKPVFLGEANYEGADNLGTGVATSPKVLRAQQYWLVLAGGLAGQIWGNKTLHHFTVYNQTVTAATNATTTITATVGSVTNLHVGQQVNVTGATGGTWTVINGVQTVVSIVGSTFTFVVGVAPTGSYTGSSATANGSWQNNLNTVGAQDATRWAAFFRSYPWTNLVPDTGHTFVTGGYGTYDTSATGITAVSGAASVGTYAEAALTADGTLGLCYTPVNQGLIVALSKMSGPGHAQWWDPTNGAYTSIGSFTNTGSTTYTPSATNSAGDTDWVLVLTVP